MNRLVGLALALTLVGVGGTARAQIPASTYGGFGMEYAQTMPPNTYVLDRWWMVQGTPSVGPALPPQSVVQAPANVQPVNPRRAMRAARRARVLSRVGTPAYGQAGLQGGTPLPTGSLYWPAQAGAPLYSPAQRYAAYGEGYGVSPYGSADYGYQYKGIYWGR